ncbi:SDR family oxidoreductase [Ralstonia pseudosolanacearum]|uniref:SDR family oxidoreductase n=1 Tax=Ralstonia pseudosolanacearum TaxID=1310165 RepID=UPI003865A8D0
MRSTNTAADLKTVLITGCSTGFGLATAQLFLERGWRVVATMRTPQEGVLPPSDRLEILSLDVSDPESIRRAVDQAGRIDVLVNNAGKGLINIFESSTSEQIREIFETNTIGLMEVTKAVLPQFRARKAGVIVNVASFITFSPYPMFSVYTASKAAVVSFTEILAVELAQLNIRARIVDPGWAPSTAFEAGMTSRVIENVPAEYSELVSAMSAGRASYQGPFTESVDVAGAIWQAATDPSSPTRIPAGADAEALAASASRSTS